MMFSYRRSRRRLHRWRARQRRDLIDPRSRERRRRRWRGQRRLHRRFGRGRHVPRRERCRHSPRRRVPGSRARSPRRRAGTDVADYSRRSVPLSLTISVFATPTPNGGAPGEGDDLDSVETLVGGAGVDTLEVQGTAKASLFTSLKDPVYALRGNAGADTLRAIGHPRTSMDGGAGSDTLAGGNAVDVIFSREGEFDRITCVGRLRDPRPERSPGGPQRGRAHPHRPSRRGGHPPGTPAVPTLRAHRLSGSAFVAARSPVRPHGALLAA